MLTLGRTLLILLPLLLLAGGALAADAAPAAQDVRAVKVKAQTMLVMVERDGARVCESMLRFNVEGRDFHVGVPNARELDTQSLFTAHVRFDPKTQKPVEVVRLEKDGKAVFPVVSDKPAAK